MGYLFTMLEAPPPEKKRETASVELMHKMGCKMCPRANAQCRSPDMRPSGHKDPFIYVLGGQPDVEDDQDDVQFSEGSKGGRLLRAYFPEDLVPDTRWNYIVRTFKNNEKLNTTEIECCRPSVERDIEESKPDAIWGFGLSALQWVWPGARIGEVRGRRFPVKIGSHVCWYYCFDDPIEVKRPQMTKWGDWKVDPQREQVFKFDLKRAADMVYTQDDDPVFHTRAEAVEGIEVVTKTKGGLKRVIELLQEAAEQEEVGFDYETSTLRPYRANATILSVGIAWASKAFSFPLHHRQAGWTEAELRKINDAMVDLLQSQAYKAVHNLAFELEWTGVKYGTQYIRNDNWDDTTSQAFILDARTSNKKSRNGPGSLHFQCLLHFGLPLKELSPEIDSNSKKNMAAVNLDALLPYNALDAKYHYLLMRAQRKALLQMEQYDSYKMKVGHVRTVTLTQIKGAPIDADANQRFFDTYSARVDEAIKLMERTNAYDQFKLKFNKHFNPGSDKDIAQLLEEIIQTQHGKQKDGTYSTEKEVLEKIRNPIIKPLLEWRRATKALSTYVLPLRPDSEHNYDGWIHPVYNTNSTKTGRLSSEHPNAQNFPVRDPEMGKVREQIGDTEKTRKKGEPRKLVMKVDYGQIEARVIAMVSRDAVFVKALWERYDVHMAWAEKIVRQAPRVLNRWPQGDDYKDMKARMKALRTAVKNEWTFPLFFGAQLSGVAKFLQVDERLLEPLREEFWDTFKGVRAWQKKLEREYQQTGEITYITGRKARGPLSTNQLYNYPIQGPTCDIMLDAMARVSARSVEDWDYQPMFQIHDDLTFLLPEDRLGDYAENIITDMLSVPFDFVNVPIVAEVAIGPNWHDVKSEGDFSSDRWFKEAA